MGGLNSYLVFKDGTNFKDYNLMVFRGFLTGLETPVRTDVVMLAESQLESNSKLLYREINRDKIALTYG